ncbi:hypothetical protein EIKCOROL_01484 [Eikenella corrodens ATCC 23834]|uniref:Uncharacterized protein n=1 Tax=Eikenella corrodens ATCC 23834 TaxID=546274 RepID=C0DVU3_EIKCO|nr:hypothetical protein EIKCOROL_01484 [Eikenella corrodens ATCC 23834]
MASTFSGSLIANQLNTHYSVGSPGCAPTTLYSELTKTSTALVRLAVLFVLSAARRLVLI